MTVSFKETNPRSLSLFDNLVTLFFTKKTWIHAPVRGCSSLFGRHTHKLKTHAPVQGYLSLLRRAIHVFRPPSSGGCRSSNQTLPLLLHAAICQYMYCTFHRHKNQSLWDSEPQSFQVISILLPVVPHKAMADVSKIGNLQEGLFVVNHGWQSEAMMDRKVIDVSSLSLSFSLFLSLSLSFSLFLFLSLSFSLFLSLSLSFSLFLSLSLSFSLFLSLSLSFSLFLSLSLSLFLSFSDYLPTYLPTYRSTYLSIYLPTYLPIYLSINQSIYLSIYLSLYLSFSLYLSISLPISLPIYLSVYLSK